MFWKPGVFCVVLLVLLVLVLVLVLLWLMYVVDGVDNGIGSNRF